MLRRDSWRGQQALVFGAVTLPKSASPIRLAGSEAPKVAYHCCAVNCVVLAQFIFRSSRFPYRQCFNVAGPQSSMALVATLISARQFDSAVGDGSPVFHPVDFLGHLLEFQG